MNSTLLIGIVNDDVRRAVQASVRNYTDNFVDNSVGYRAYNSVKNYVAHVIWRSTIDSFLGPVWDSAWKIVVKYK